MKIEPTADRGPIIAEIISTGNEVVTGAVTDSNAAFIAQQLQAAGLQIQRHACVVDDMSTLTQTIKETSGRADIAVVSGGLGPTHDDITRDAAAAAAETRLAKDPDALQSVVRFFDQRGFEMTPRNERQAWLPEGALCLANPIGTAPGFVLQISRCRFFFLPGVPKEMRRMMTDQVLPAVLKRYKGSGWILRKTTLVVFGMGESAVSEKLAAFQTHSFGVTLGLQAVFPEIRINLYGSSTNADTLDHHMTAAVDWIKAKIGHHVVSDEDKPLERVVGDLLKKGGKTVAVAESCTGGLIAHKLTQVAGSSDYFVFGAVTYANEAKIAALGVLPETLQRHGAVDEQTAAEMAEGARRIGRTDYALATTGIAGPTGGSAQKPVGTVCIGLATPHGSEGRRFHFPYNDRTMNKVIFAETALDMLRRHLIQTEQF